MSAREDRIWIAVRLIDLPLSVLVTTTELIKSTAVIQRKRVICASAEAHETGVSFGMDATTAQVLSGCVVMDRDEPAEMAALDHLSSQLYQFTPYIEKHICRASAQAGLMLEVSTCLRLFGGLSALADRLHQVMSGTGHGFVFGLGHTARCAWYLSHGEYIITGTETRQDFNARLHQLPIELLRDHPKAVESLTKTGFATFGDVASQIGGKSLSGFRKRIGADAADALCDAFGIDHFAQASLFAAPRDVYRPGETFERDIQFEYPVTIVDHLAPAIEALLVLLCEYLRKRQQQCQSIEWVISDIYRSKVSVPVNCDMPQSAWPLLYDLSLIQFNARELPFEVDTIRLGCPTPTQVQSSNQALAFDGAPRRGRSSHGLEVAFAKLKARLGDANVYKLGYRDNRVPELTNVVIPLNVRSPQSLPDTHANALRPCWIFPAPEAISERDGRLHWRGYLELLHGPERIIGPWWSTPVARDYYMARRQDNVRVWVYFDLYAKSWFAHGVFS